MISQVVPSRFSECFQTFPSRLARTRSTTRSSSTSSYRWPLQGGATISVSLFKREKACMYLCQMISKQRATSVGFDDLVDAFRFECRVHALDACRKFQPPHPKDHWIRSSIFSFTLLFSKRFPFSFFSVLFFHLISNYFRPFPVLPPPLFRSKSCHPPFKPYFLYLVCSPSLLNT